MRDKIISLLDKGILISPNETEIHLDDKISLKEEINTNQKIIIKKNYVASTDKKTFKNFVTIFNSRYKELQSMLRNRQEVQDATSIRKVLSMDERSQITVIGMVLDKKLTKNNNIILTLEDQTAVIKGIITQRNKEAFEMAKDLCFDEVIGIQGSKGKGVIFINNIISPDIPLNKELKKSPNDHAAVFISDIHIGSKMFLKDDFEKFISWIRGETGTDEQKNLVKKIKYLFIIGDLVEGIGIFPGQEKELEYEDIYDQFNEFNKYVEMIPKSIQIIICSGNHDPVRIAEPQPPIPKQFVEPIYNNENITWVSSPSVVNIENTEHFSGFDILLYHGFSFPYYGSTIESLRMKGGIESVENIMTYLLKKRHLAPAHGSTQYHLGFNYDPLIIKEAPDFFVTGHIHKSAIKTYRGVTLLNCSCWISQTDYQEKRGITPDPGRVFYVNLKNRETKIINFYEK
jgi:DNA polymerase II small subunit